MSGNLFCKGNQQYSDTGRENYERTFRDGKSIEFEDKYGFWSEPPLSSAGMKQCPHNEFTRCRADQNCDDCEIKEND